MRTKGARIPDPKDFVSCPGDRFHIEYRPQCNKDGTITLVECGKTDIQEFIQSFLEFTDMSYIIKQLELGNTSVLNQRRPIYADFSQAPTNFAEYHQIILDGQRAFMDLPLEVRNSYDHDLNKFLADIGSEKWNQVMKDYLPHKEVDSVKEVSEDA